MDLAMVARWLKGGYIEAWNTRVRSFDVSTLLSKNLAGTTVLGYVKESSGTILNSQMPCYAQQEIRHPRAAVAPFPSTNLLFSYLNIKSLQYILLCLIASNSR